MTPSGALKEVVKTREEASSMELSPLLIVDPLKEYLAEIELIQDKNAPLTWDRIGEGHSNITYALESDGNRYVLRRGPRPPLPQGTHDMPREARIQSVLHERGVKTPKILAVCEDNSVMGAPFYLMNYLDGPVITDEIPQQFSAPETQGTIALAAIDSLAQLHSVDTAEGAIATLGKPAGYLERQVERFANAWPGVSLRPMPAMDELAEWLRDNMPQSQKNSVVHGDFRIGNLMFERELDSDGSANVLAILDWEMATLGDPLADLGYFLATYSHGDSRPTPLDLTPITRSKNFASRTELAARYAEQTGANLDYLPWYKSLALWKAAVFTEAIYTRWLRGERPNDSFVSTLEYGVPQLLEEAKYARY